MSRYINEPWQVINQNYMYTSEYAYRHIHCDFAVGWKMFVALSTADKKKVNSAVIRAFAWWAIDKQKEAAAKASMQVLIPYMSNTTKSLVAKLAIRKGFQQVVDDFIRSGGFEDPVRLMKLVHDEWHQQQSPEWELTYCFTNIELCLQASVSQIGIAIQLIEYAYAQSDQSVSLREFVLDLIYTSLGKPYRCPDQPITQANYLVLAAHYQCFNEVHKSLMKARVAAKISKLVPSVSNEFYSAFGEMYSDELQRAIHHEVVSKVELIYSDAADVKAALKQACQLGDIKAVGHLLKNEWQTTYPRDFARDIMLAAVDSNKPLIVKALLNDHRFNLVLLTDSSRQCFILTHAAVNQYHDIVRVMLASNQVDIAMVRNATEKLQSLMAESKQAYQPLLEQLNKYKGYREYVAVPAVRWIQSFWRGHKTSLKSTGEHIESESSPETHQMFHVN